MHTAKAFFHRKKMAFSVVRIVPGTPDVTRTYKRFTDVVDDTIDGISCPDTFAHVPSALRHSAEGSAMSRIETEPLTVTAYAVMIQRAAKTAGAALIEGELEKPGRTGAGALPGGK
jgi:hypothetical protein